MTLCTAAFVSGLDPDAAYREEVRNAPGMRWVTWAMRYEVDRVHREVRTSIASGPVRRSIYREGQGCVLALHEVPADVWRQPVEAAWPSDPYPSLEHPETLTAVDARLRNGRGYLGQFIVIVPSQDLVIVRLGISYRRAAISRRSAIWLPR